MKEKRIRKSRQQETVTKEKGAGIPVFFFMAGLLIVVIAGAVFFLSRYHPAPAAPAAPVSLNAKLASIQSGSQPLAGQSTRPAIPLWLMAVVFGFAIAQMIPLVLAAYKAQATEFTRGELRLIEFLTETPLFLGLLGSLVGICMTQFISGSLAAPLAYLTTMTGILLYLLGRFTILVSLPPSNELD